MFQCLHLIPALKFKSSLLLIHFFLFLKFFLLGEFEKGRKKASFQVVKPK